MTRPGDVFFKEPESDQPKPDEVDQYARSGFIREIAVAFIRAGISPPDVAGSVLTVLRGLDASVE